MHDRGVAEPEPPARRNSLFTTPRDMVWSMAVIVGIAVVILLLVPRPDALPVRSIDVASSATELRPELGFAPAVPRGLDDGWVARDAQVQRGTDGLPTWHVTYVTPSGEVAGIQQAARATPAWESRQVTDGREQGTRSVAGVDWVIRSRTDRGVTSLVRRPSGSDPTTTVVTGSGSQAELDQLAASVVP